MLQHIMWYHSLHDALTLNHIFLVPWMACAVNLYIFRAGGCINNPQDCQSAIVHSHCAPVRHTYMVGVGHWLWGTCSPDGDK